MTSPRIITIANQKGGVGKTTTAIHLATALAQKETRVLLIDLDVQGNASSIFLDAPLNPEETVFAIFKDRAAVGQIARPTRDPGLDILAATIHLAEVESMLAGAVDGYFRLSDCIRSAELPYDYVIIDCPPNLGVLPVNAFVAASHVVVPLQTSKFSLDGIRGILDTTRVVQKRYNADLSIMGALLTQFNPRTAISQAMVEQMGSLMPLFETRISRAVAVEEAHLMKKTIFEYQPKSKVAREYEAFTREVVDGIKKR